MCHTPRDPTNIPWVLVGEVVGAGAGLFLSTWVVQKYYPQSDPWCFLGAIQAILDVYVDVKLIVHLFMLGWMDLFWMALAVLVLDLGINTVVTLAVSGVSPQ